MLAGAGGNITIQTGKDGILMVPHMIFIDPKGTITADHGDNAFFGAAMDKNIRTQLDQMAAKAPAKKK